MTDKNSKLYRESKTPNYMSEIFEDVGHGLCISLLDWCEINPVSRMPTSFYKNLESIKRELIVQHSLYPYDQIREMRKEVHQEKLLMKSNFQKLQAQLYQKSQQLFIDNRKNT